MNDETYLTASELASRWKKSLNTLANWRCNGKGPRYTQPGGKRCPVRYPLSGVVEYEKKHQRTCEAD